jgi:hypothetical protein
LGENTKSLSGDDGKLHYSVEERFVLAYVFHFPPSEIDNLDIEDFNYWMAKAWEILETRRDSGESL